jgi:hypothetical protein
VIEEAGDVSVRRIKRSEGGGKRGLREETVGVGLRR